MLFSQSYLPIELWQNVFRQSGNPIVQIQCGMVCKTWMTLVDAIIYKEINLDSMAIREEERDWNNYEDDMNACQAYHLYQHLLKNPDLCQRIQVITLGKGLQYFHFAKDLLKLAITPNIRILNGHWNDRFITFLREEVLSPAKKFDNMAQLPRTFVRENGLRWLQLYKESLTTIHLTIHGDKQDEFVRQSISKTLNQVKHLTRLEIKFAYLHDVQELEDILKNCHQIRELELQIEEISEYKQKDRGELEDRLSKGVHPLENLQSLSVTFTKRIDHYTAEERQTESRTYGPDWIEYLTFKFPGIKTLKIKNKSTDYEHIALPYFGNAEYFILEDWVFYDFDLLQDFIDKYKSPYNSVRIECFIPNMDGSIKCEMDTVVNTRTNHTTFIIKVPDNDHYEENTTLILTSLSSISIDNLDITSYRESYQVGLSTHLKSLQSARGLRMGSLKIPYEDFMHDLDQSMMTSVELDQVHVDPRSITQLSKFASKLENLKIQNCIFEHQINVPFSHLKTLTVCETGRIPIQDCRLRGNIFIRVVSNAELSQQYFFARSNKPVVQVSQQEYELYSDELNTIHINCKSLRRLNVCLGHVSLTLQFDDQSKVKHGNPRLIIAPDLTTLNAKYIALEEKSRLDEHRRQSLEKMYSQAKQHLTEAQIQAIEENI